MFLQFFFLRGVRNIATTGIWKVTTRLDNVLAYIIDSKKTSVTDEMVHQLHSVDKMNDLRETNCYVTGINCNPEIAYEEMMMTKQQFNKNSGILGFHAFQSFEKNEVSAEQAHEIGVKLAKEMWGDRFEVVVSTHLNTNHYHNHFLINSVSFVDGKKYYDNRVNYARIRELSDSLCEEYNLSVLKEKKCKRSNINYRNYYNKYVNSNNYYSVAKEDVDRAIVLSNSYQEFESLMRIMNYDIIYRNTDTISIRHKDFNKNIRLSRSFGKDYTISKIKERIKLEHDTKISFFKERKFNYKKCKGLAGIYLYYCYLLGMFSNKRRVYKVPYSLRADVKGMDSISKQTELLVSNNIETYEQLFSFRKDKVTQLNSLLTERTKLKSNKLVGTNEDKIAFLSLQIKTLRNDIKLCDKIEDRSIQIKSNIEEYENGKEVVKNAIR